MRVCSLRGADAGTFFWRKKWWVGRFEVIRGGRGRAPPGADSGKPEAASRVYEVVGPKVWALVPGSFEGAPIANGLSHRAR